MLLTASDRIWPLVSVLLVASGLQVPLGFTGSQDPRVLLPDDKMHAMYQWSTGHEQGPSILDKLSMWAYDKASHGRGRT